MRAGVVFQIDGASCEGGGSKRLQGRCLAALKVDAVFSVAYPDAASANSGSDALAAVQTGTVGASSVASALNAAGNSYTPTVAATVAAPVAAIPHSASHRCGNFAERNPQRFRRIRKFQTSCKSQNLRDLYVAQAGLVRTGRTAYEQRSRIPYHTGG